MNIFAIEGNGDDIDLVASARSHDNMRVVKMPVEACQMLSNVMRFHGLHAPYRKAYENHPCSRWSMESDRNFLELVAYGKALCAEYTVRYRKTHACERVLWRIEHDFMNAMFDSSHRMQFASHTLTPLPLCMPNEFKLDTIVDSQRAYWVSKTNMRYPKGRVPVWFREMRTLPFIEV